MENEGHYVTGMTNQIVWGLPHIFAVLLIVISSGVLNIASLSSVFNKELYKPLAPLSSLLAIAFLIAGLAILVLDLGRPNRLIVAMTVYNFKSIFAWNIFLYTGFAVVLAGYIWTMLDHEVKKYSKPVGIFAFTWRIILTTGTGSIFGFLVAREAYATAILAPLFIVMSLLYGVVVYYLLLVIINKLHKTIIEPEVIENLKKLTIMFLFANLYFLFLYHLTNMYISKHLEFEIFILFNGGIYTAVFWLGQVLVGIILPLIFLLTNKICSYFSLLISSVFVLFGSFMSMFVIIIAGQAYPLTIFPDHTIVESSFYDNVIHSYVPSIYELGLGIGGIALALIIVLIGLANLKFLPKIIQSKNNNKSLEISSVD
ncbi:MAG: polysulfide reductase NrfD [Pelagibacterales bacterium]|nr:polysulfide reductase NrfD [Pelagibacterales bacterium]